MKPLAGYRTFSKRSPVTPGPVGREEFFPERVQKVIDAACELKNISQDDSRDAVLDDALRKLEGAAEELTRIEFERDREGDLAGIPDDACLGKIHRYDAHLTRRYHKALHDLQRLQAARHGLRPSAPVAVDVDIGGGLAG